jgi:hypothetical protein
MGRLSSVSPEMEPAMFGFSARIIGMIDDRSAGWHLDRR